MEPIMIKNDDGTVRIITPSLAFFESKEKDKMKDLIFDLKRTTFK